MSIASSQILFPAHVCSLFIITSLDVVVNRFPSLAAIPSRPIVIPQAVDTSSIQLNQVTDGSLVISWLPVANVNYGEVSYDIRVSYIGGNCTAVSSQCAIILQYI